MLLFPDPEGPQITRGTALEDVGPTKLNIKLGIYFHKV